MRWTQKPAIHSPNLHTGVGVHVHTYGYGLGLMIGSYETLDFVHHGGYTPPYGSQFSLLPSENIGVFTSTNQTPLKVPPLALHAFIVETLRGSEDATEKAMKVMEDVRRKEEAKLKRRAEIIEKFLEESKTLAGGKKPEAEEIVGKYGSGAIGQF